MSLFRLDRLTRSNATTNNDLALQEFARLSRYKKLQDKNLVLGGLHHIKYKYYKHDPTPLVIFFNEVIFSPEGHKLLPGLNLNYLNNVDSNQVMRVIKNMNGIRLGQGLGPAIVWELARRIPLKYFPYRLYIENGIKPEKYIPVSDWDKTTRNISSRWRGFRDF